MAVRITIERILRDDDDATGQNIRRWTINADPGFVTLRHDGNFILIQTDDVDILISDLQRAKRACIDLASEKEKPSPGEPGKG